MPDNYLVVPMQLDALAVNQAVLSRDTFRWWQFNYIALTHFKSPEPQALERASGTPAPGVYLHWTLPRALRHGAQNQQTGDVEYPLVPNRWLILRFGGTTQRQATAGWVLESDCPTTDKTPNVDTGQTSMYLIDPAIFQMWKSSSDAYRNSVAFNDRTGKSLDPSSNQPLVANIGVPFPLGQNWNERAADAMFLTAIAPANDVFSVYYSHNVGVFSFYDNLQGIDKDTLSYLVVGWYSNPQKDIMASWPQNTASKTPYQDLLDTLQWTVGASDVQATASLYEGMAFSIGWERNGTAPANDALQNIDRSKLNFAIGNTTVDAFSTLVNQQFQTKGYSAQTIKLLEAFQYDLLPVLNQPNGDALLDEKIRQAWYGSKPGGYSWTIVARESDGSASVELTAAEAQWLLQLNKDQATLDAAVEELYSLQWTLNANWYRKGFLSDTSNVFPNAPQGITNMSTYLSQLNAQLDPTQPGSIASQVLTQINSVKILMGKVPQPDWSNTHNDQEAFQTGINAFSSQKALDGAKVLKAVAAPRYWKPNNPVIVMSGVEPPPAVDPNQSLTVRLATHLVTGFNVDGKPVNTTNAGSVIPMPGNLSNLPAPIPSLIQEYFFLDPTSATSIAAATGTPVSHVTPVMTAHSAADYLGTLPALNLNLWMQPWNPMYMEWRISYTYIPYQTNNQPMWRFDGTDYHFTPGSVTPAVDPPRDIGGISPLSTTAQFVFGSRLEDFIEKYGTETNLKDVYNWINEIDNWKFLSQELVGFNDMMALRDQRAFRRPSPQDVIGTGANQYALADLIGYSGDMPDGPYSLPDVYKGHVNSFPLIPNGAKLPFHGVRQGQGYFEDLYLYDQFGRTLHVIQSNSTSGTFDYKNFPLIRDEAFNVDTQLNPNIAGVAQFPPRVLQFARLDFDLVDGKVDAQVLGLDEGVNPVCGWVLPNHLDNSILVFAPDGTSLGEFRLVETAQGTKVGEWQAPAHSKINSLDDVARVAPRLEQMLSAAHLKDEANFQAFLEAIDSTLWTVDQLGNRADKNLSVLIGRPLALVRARLRFSLDGSPIKDTSWDVALNPPDPDFLNYNFAIRLGDQATYEDGLIGYYFGDNYEVFNSVVSAETTAAQGYVNEIGPLGTSGGSNYIPLQFKENTAAYVTLLTDPRAAIHAVTGILPIKQLDIPPRFVDDPLANIEVSFRIGPMLTAIEPTPAQGDHTPLYANAISYPFPAEQNGQWSWWESDAATNNWNGYTLLNTTSNAKLKSVPNSLRDGILQLVLNLQNKKS